MKPRTFRWLAALFRRRRLEAETAEELRSHIEKRAADLERSGLGPADARRRAQVEFGGYENYREECREALRAGLGESFFQDLRHAFRLLRRSPTFAAAAVLTLALGIGANTAIFSVVNALLLKSLPVKDPRQLVFLTNPDVQGAEAGFNDGDRDFLTYPEFQQLSRDNRVFSGLVAACAFSNRIGVTLDSSDPTGDAPPASISLVSGSYFPVLGVRPLLGLVFGAEVDSLRDANPVAVISYRFWLDRLGGDPNAVGRKIRIRRTSYDIIGILPPQFRGETVGVAPDVWVPLTMQAEVLPGHDYLSQEPNPFHKIEWLQVIGRLRPGVGLAQAGAGINVAFQQILRSQIGGMSSANSRSFLKQRLAVVEGSHGASSLRQDFGKPVQILMAVVGLILLIACANVANLLLARSAARQREIALRVALGAGPVRLLRQVLTESLLLAAIGAVAGLLLAAWADAGLVRLVAASGTAASLDVHLDPAVLGFTAAVALFTGILLGIVPALRAARVDLNSTLKAGMRGSGGARAPVAKALVVAQVALSLLLLAAAGLFLRSFQKLAGLSLGYDTSRLVVFGVSPLVNGYPKSSISQLYRNLVAAVDGVAGVRGVTFVDNGLFTGLDSSSPISVEGQKPPTLESRDARWDTVGPGFFSTVGIPILAGREIGPGDVAGAQRVGLINQALARLYFPNTSPIGKRVMVHTTSTDADFVVVGVVADSKHGSVREQPRPRFYVPFLNPIGEMNSAEVVVRAAGDPAGVIPAIRAAVKRAAPNLPAPQIVTINQRLAESLSSDRMVTQLSGAFAALAIVLVCIGLYGVMAYSVAGRTGEIGIRIALGAERDNVVWLVLREALVLVSAGVAIGLPAVLGAGRWLASLLFGVKPADPLAIAVATALMFSIGILACSIPARRAMRVDPIAALRNE